MMIELHQHTCIQCLASADIMYRKLQPEFSLHVWRVRLPLSACREFCALSRPRPLRSDPVRKPGSAMFTMSVRLCGLLWACLMEASFHSSSQAMPSVAPTSALCSMNNPCRAAPFAVRAFQKHWQHVFHHVCEALRLAPSLLDGS